MKHINIISLLVLMFVIALTITGCSTMPSTPSTESPNEQLAPPIGNDVQDTINQDIADITAEFDELEFDLEESFPDLSDW